MPTGARSTYSREQVGRMTVAQMRSELARRQLSTTGRKAELEARLRETLEDGSAGESEEVDVAAVSRMKVAELRTQLRVHGLDTAGRKADLQRRLVQALHGESSATEREQVEEEQAVHPSSDGADSETMERPAPPVTALAPVAPTAALASATRSKRPTAEPPATLPPPKRSRFQSATPPPANTERPLPSATVERASFTASPPLPSTPFRVLERCVSDASPCLVSCRNDKKLYGILRAYDKHFNLILEQVRELWRERPPARRTAYGAAAAPDRSSTDQDAAILHERFIPKLFVRGDTVIFVLRPRL